MDRSEQEVSRIAAASLADQCEALGIAFEERIVPELRIPELQAFEMLKPEGYDGTYCEGGAILTLLKALCLDFLAEHNPFASREDACRRFLEAQIVMLRNRRVGVLEAISTTTHARAVENLQEICADSLVREWYPGLECEAIEHLHNAIDHDALVEVARVFVDDPYTYRSGWPDLTLARGRDVRFVEVKTTDKLHPSQIITISAMLGAFPGCFSVMRLLRLQ
jgi:hypothetical protein